MATGIRSFVDEELVPIPDGLLPDLTVVKERGNHTMVIRRKEMATDPVCRMNVEPETPPAWN
jgi:hypothetical protein